MRLPSCWTVHRRQGWPFSSASAESSSLLASWPCPILAHLSRGLPRDHTDSRSADLPSAAASQDLRVPDPSPDVLLGGQTLLQCPGPNCWRQVALWGGGFGWVGAAGKGLACRAEQRSQCREDRAALSLAINLAPFPLVWRKRVRRRSWLLLWASFQKPVSPAQGTWPVGCARSSVQSYPPWETSVRGSHCSPSPPISHCISCHME